MDFVLWALGVVLCLPLLVLAVYVVIAACACAAFNAAVIIAVIIGVVLNLAGQMLSITWIPYWISYAVNRRRWRAEALESERRKEEIRERLRNNPRMTEWLYQHSMRERRRSTNQDLPPVRWDLPPAPVPAIERQSPRRAPEPAPRPAFPPAAAPMAPVRTQPVSKPPRKAPATIVIEFRKAALAPGTNSMKPRPEREEPKPCPKSPHVPEGPREPELLKRFPVGPFQVAIYKDSQRPFLEITQEADGPEDFRSGRFKWPSTRTRSDRSSKSHRRPTARLGPGRRHLSAT